MRKLALAVAVPALLVIAACGSVGVLSARNLKKPLGASACGRLLNTTM